MQTTIQNMRPDEQASLRLRRLYESRGFQRVRPGKFEEHALYVENKNFFSSEQMITFMDMDGKLLALKPDVTLSVVKNIPSEALPTFRKLYYLDEVYRVSRENREYRAISQIGVELAGPPDAFAGIEIVDLALLSLEAIGERYVLDLSHLGFVAGMLAELDIPHTLGRQVLAAIHDKSFHELAALLEGQGLPEQAAHRLTALTQLHGEIASALEKAKELISGAEMQAAWDELDAVAKALSYNGFAGRLNLDFSVMGDLDYYNGLVFRGYVEGLPQSILSGGRYDNLMKRMGKRSGAAGFAVSLDELNTRTGRGCDFDAVITYSEDCDRAALLHTVREMTESGQSVRLERADARLSAADFTWKRLYHFTGRELTAAGEGSQC